MLTKTKKRANRWQALALAALLLAGGSIAVPQAADAATTGTAKCNNWVEWCTVRITVVKKSSGKPTLSIRADGGFIERPFYVADSRTGGTIVCTGTLPWTTAARTCKVPNHTTVLTVFIRKHAWEGMTLHARAS